ncbi:MAG TPA: 30S ribosomal protein S2 [Phycisphaerae bacterium]|nr:30S ribosomal protein S2 [Phycisphaerae bacterium]
MATLQVQELIDAGIHFGHPASRWNPKMAPYIYGRRNFIHIIDLKETVKGILRAQKFLTRLVAEGKDVIFVGTKRQARASIEQEAQRCLMPYVSYRWLGGALTNFRTIRSRLGRLDELDHLVESGEINRYSKKMIAALQREHRKMKRNLDGIRKMERLPGALIVVDPVREKNAVREATKLDIPVVALADTEADPDDLTVVIPGNDDAMRAIEIVIKHLADACAEGLANRAARAVVEGEGQALVRAPSRPRARAAPRRGERPVPEMPLPTPHPAMQEAAGTTPAGQADAPADPALPTPENDAAAAAGPDTP